MEKKGTDSKARRKVASCRQGARLTVAGGEERKVLRGSSARGKSKKKVVRGGKRNV